MEAKIAIKNKAVKFTLYCYYAVGRYSESEGTEFTSLTPFRAQASGYPETVSVRNYSRTVEINPVALLEEAAALWNTPPAPPFTIWLQNGIMEVKLESTDGYGRGALIAKRLWKHNGEWRDCRYAVEGPTQAIGEAVLRYDGECLEVVTNFRPLADSEPGRY